MDIAAATRASDAGCSTESQNEPSPIILNKKCRLAKLNERKFDIFIEVFLFSFVLPYIKRPRDACGSGSVLESFRHRQNLAGLGFGRS